ncbi:MAG: hypothetical protein GC150_12300 [Rhizobiales bacterium]|nr:hypothetical protein [Hyphomicrobiales bacterium]
MAAISMEWWLNAEALPEHDWARLLVTAQGACVKELDGGHFFFPSLADAIAWLRAEDYRSLEDLKEYGLVPIGLAPPAAGAPGC